jgi:hypothetical protein
LPLSASKRRFLMSIPMSGVRPLFPFFPPRFQIAQLKARLPFTSLTLHQNITVDRHDTVDAAKTKPSRFQQRQGSVHATPPSRDSHTDKNKERDSGFHKAVDSMKSGLWGGRRKSTASKEDDKGEALEKKMSRESGEKK